MRAGIEGLLQEYTPEPDDDNFQLVGVSISFFEDGTGHICVEKMFHGSIFPGLHSTYPVTWNTWEEFMDILNNNEAI